MIFSPLLTCEQTSICAAYLECSFGCSEVVAADKRQDQGNDKFGDGRRMFLSGLAELAIFLDRMCKRAVCFTWVSLLEMWVHIWASSVGHMVGAQQRCIFQVQQSLRGKKYWQ
jgi:hypothetical protein